MLNPRRVLSALALSAFLLGAGDAMVAALCGGDSVPETVALHDAAGPLGHDHGHAGHAHHGSHSHAHEADEDPADGSGHDHGADACPFGGAVMTCGGAAGLLPAQALHRDLAPQTSADTGLTAPLPLPSTFPDGPFRPPRG